MALHARVIPSPEMDAKHASGAISAATRTSHNGTMTSPLHTSYRMPSNINLYSRNCTKHNCRCDYQDLTEAQSISPTVGRGPDLMMTPEIEMEIDNWHRTGVPPYPELMQCPRMGWSSLSRSDLRLIHHIVGLSIDLHRRGLSNCTVWAQKMPK